MNPDRYRERRQRVLEQIAAAGGGVAVLPTAPERFHSRDTPYPYRPDSYFWWLTGFGEPDAVLVLVADDTRRESILYCQPNLPERAQWDGERWGPEAAREAFGFDAAHPVEALDADLPTRLARARDLYAPATLDEATGRRLQDWIGAARRRARGAPVQPGSVHDLHGLLDELRLVKDADELDTLRRAAQLSGAAHLQAMRACRPGLREYHLEAELLHAFRAGGAQGPAYPPIVAAGRNACVLHHPAGDAVLADGALCLIDAGCELDGYAADLTRTFPVNGRYDGAQRALHEVVEAAQQAAIAAVRPGARFDAPHHAATAVLVRGLVDLGLLHGEVDSLIEAGAQRRFFMHRTSHWLGLDVHDVGDPREPGLATGPGDPRPWRTLAAGMVLTVEPGLYVPVAEDLPPAFHGLGIRIEDDVAVTADGCEVLSATLPRTAAAIEAAMRERP